MGEDIFRSLRVEVRATPPDGDIKPIIVGLPEAYGALARLCYAAQRLADAADAVGVKYFDTDELSPEVEEMQAATLALRELIP